MPRLSHMGNGFPRQFRKAGRARMRSRNHRFIRLRLGAPVRSELIQMGPLLRRFGTQVTGSFPMAVYRQGMVIRRRLSSQIPFRRRCVYFYVWSAAGRTIITRVLPQGLSINSAAWGVCHIGPSQIPVTSLICFSGPRPGRRASRPDSMQLGIRFT